MKPYWFAFSLLTCLATPPTVQAQSTVTRAQARRELEQLEGVGYRPARNDIHYPDSIREAEAKLNSVNVATPMGDLPGSHSGADSRQSKRASLGDRLYAHH